MKNQEIQKPKRVIEYDMNEKVEIDEAFGKPPVFGNQTETKEPQCLAGFKNEEEVKNV